MVYIMTPQELSTLEKTNEGQEKDCVKRKCNNIILQAQVDSKVYS